MTNSKKPVYDSLTEKERLAVDLFFGVLNNYSSSTELVTTWLGRNPEEGGRVLIGWNTLVKLVWKCISVSKGLEKLPPEVEKLLKS